jgi:hypothetical protein
MKKFNTFFGHLEYFSSIWSFGNLVAIWYVLPVLVYCVNKNLAILKGIRQVSVM